MNNDEGKYQTIVVDAEHRVAVLQFLEDSGIKYKAAALGNAVGACFVYEDKLREIADAGYDAAEIADEFLENYDWCH